MPCPKCSYSGEPIIIMPAALLNDWNPIRCPECKGKDRVGYSYDQWFAPQFEGRETLTAEGIGVNAQGSQWRLKDKLGRDAQGEVEVRSVERIG